MQTIAQQLREEGIKIGEEKGKGEKEDRQECFKSFPGE
jgi:hypothetical protein